MQAVGCILIQQLTINITRNNYILTNLLCMGMWSPKGGSIVQYSDGGSFCQEFCRDITKMKCDSELNNSLVPATTVGGRVYVGNDVIIAYFECLMCLEATSIVT